MVIDALLLLDSDGVAYHPRHTVMGHGSHVVPVQELQVIWRVQEFCKRCQNNTWNDY